MSQLLVVADLGLDNPALAAVLVEQDRVLSLVEEAVPRVVPMKPEAAGAVGDQVIHEACRVQAQDVRAIDPHVPSVALGRKQLVKLRAHARRERRCRFDGSDLPVVAVERNVAVADEVRVWRERACAEMRVPVRDRRVDDARGSRHRAEALAPLLAWSLPPAWSARQSNETTRPLTDR